MSNTRLRSLTLLAVPICCNLILPSAAAAPKKAKAIAPKPLSVRQLVVQVMPSIVRLTVVGKDGQPFAQGSGFVVADDLIVTNSHVVENAHAVTANFESGRSEQVFGLVALDKAHDLVLLRAFTKGVRPLPLENGIESQVGDPIVAFGSPEGLGGSISTGVVSGLRMIDGLKVIQTTAPISHGSSGGALVDMRGQVAGVTSFYLTDGQNLNFARPAADIRRLILAHALRLLTWAEIEAHTKTVASAPTPVTPPPPTIADIAAEAARQVEEKERQDKITALTASITDTQKQIDACNADISGLRTNGLALLDQEKPLQKDIQDREARKQALIAQSQTDHQNSIQSQRLADQQAAAGGPYTNDFNTVIQGLSRGVAQADAGKYSRKAQNELNDAISEQAQQRSDDAQLKDLDQQVKAIVAELSAKRSALSLLQIQITKQNLDLEALAQK